MEMVAKITNSTEFSLRLPYYWKGKFDWKNHQFYCFLEATCTAKTVFIHEQFAEIFRFTFAHLAITWNAKLKIWKGKPPYRRSRNKNNVNDTVMAMTWRATNDCCTRGPQLCFKQSVDFVSAPRNKSGPAKIKSKNGRK